MLKKQDLFILPSRKEAFGLAIIEAMASGVPVIASSTEGPAEIITDQQNGLLFETENPVSLFEQIRFAYLNQAATRKIAEQAYQDVQQYGIEQTLNLHESLYKKLITPRATAFVIEWKSWGKSSKPEKNTSRTIPRTGLLASRLVLFIGTIVEHVVGLQ
jgi:glycogen synthase